MTHVHVPHGRRLRAADGSCPIPYPGGIMRSKKIAAAVAALLRTTAGAVASTATRATAAVNFEVESLDGIRQQRRPPDAGAGQYAVFARGHAPVCRRPQPAGGRAEHPADQQPDLQRRSPERLLRTPRLAVGLDVGSVPGPHLRAGSRRYRGRQHPIQRQRSAGDVHRHARRHPVHTGRGGCRAPARPTLASRSTPSTPTSTPGPCTAGRSSAWSGCATARSTATWPTTRPR